MNQNTTHNTKYHKNTRKHKLLDQKDPEPWNFTVSATDVNKVPTRCLNYLSGFEGQR